MSEGRLCSLFSLDPSGSRGADGVAGDGGAR